MKELYVKLVTYQKLYRDTRPAKCKRESCKFVTGKKKLFLFSNATRIYLIIVAQLNERHPDDGTASGFDVQDDI